MAIEKLGLNSIPSGMKNMFKRAKDIYDKKEYELTVSMLVELVKALPGFQEARDLLRSAEIEKSKKLVGFQKFMASMQAQFAIMSGKKALKTNPRDALSYAEDALAFIYSPDTLRFYSQAAVAMEDFNLAIDALERVLQLNPEDEKTIGDLIGLMKDREGFALRSMQLFQQLTAKHPRDLKIQAALRTATVKANEEAVAQKAREEEEAKSKKGHGHDVSTRGNGTNTPDLSDLEKGDRIIRSEDDIKEMISRYEQVVKSGKGTVDILRKLAEFYQKVNMHEQAIATFKMLSDKLGGVKELTLDKAIARSNFAIEEAKIQRMIESGSAEGEIQQAKADLLNMRLETGRTWINDYPNDLQLHYDQAMLLFDNDFFDEALKEFQVAKQNPQRKDLAETYVARSLAKLGRFEESEKLYKELLERLTIMDTQKLRTLYYMGLMYEAMDKKPEAMECFKTISQHDANYKDVAEKIKLYAPAAAPEAAPGKA